MFCAGEVKNDAFFIELFDVTLRGILFNFFGTKNSIESDRCEWTGESSLTNLSRFCHGEIKKTSLFCDVQLVSGMLKWLTFRVNFEQYRLLGLFEVSKWKLDFQCPPDSVKYNVIK